MSDERASRSDDAGAAAAGGAAPINAIAGVVGLAQVVARNAVPMIGILFLHWSVSNVLILYFLDTMLSMAVLFAGLARTFSPPAEGVAARVKQEFGFVFAALLVCAFLALPLGMPVGIALASTDFSLAFTLADHSLRVGLVVQSAFALWSYIALRRALESHSPNELRLKQRFGLVLMRWVAVLLVAYFGAVTLGNVGLYLLVAAYVVASIFAEVAPERFLRAMPGDFADGDAAAGRSSPRAGVSQLDAANDRKPRR